jgi:excisionase family DNA binding protein
MNAGVSEPLVISVDDAMRASNLGRTYLYTLINDGSITSIKRGKRRLIVYQSLKQFLTTEATSQWKVPPCNFA